MAHDPSGGLAGWDLEGFHSGGDTEVWKRLGAHQVTLHDDERGEIHGTRFAVWAPNAQAVRLIRDYAKEPPESMRAIWEYEHDRIMERDAKIRVMLLLAVPRSVFSICRKGLS